jgi:hypothetical protein
MSCSAAPKAFAPSLELETLSPDVVLRPAAEDMELAGERCIDASRALGVEVRGEPDLR